MLGAAGARCTVPAPTNPPKGVRRRRVFRASCRRSSAATGQTLLAEHRTGRPIRRQTVFRWTWRDGKPCSRGLGGRWRRQLRATGAGAGVRRVRTAVWTRAGHTPDGGEPRRGSGISMGWLIYRKSLCHSAGEKIVAPRLGELARWRAVAHCPTVPLRASGVDRRRKIISLLVLVALHTPTSLPPLGSSSGGAVAVRRHVRGLAPLGDVVFRFRLLPIASRSRLSDGRTCRLEGPPEITADVGE